MGFHEVQFPPDISYGSSGGPGFSTAIVEVDSGAEERIARWNSARRRYDARYGIRSHDDLSEVLTFYIARMGAAYGFRYKDWSDFTTASDHRSAPAFTDQNIGTGNGVTRVFQLVKKYTNGGVTRTRNLTKPVTATTLIGLAGVEVLAPGNWAVDTTTGLVTFVVAPGTGVAITAGCRFDVPVRFGRELDDVMNVNYETFSTGGIPDIPLIEIVEEAAVSDEFFFGGAANITLTTDISITELTGRALKVTPDAGARKLLLPDETSMQLGGPYWFITNGSAAFAFTIRNHDDTATVATVAALASYTILLGVSGWYAI